MSEHATLIFLVIVAELLLVKSEKLKKTITTTSVVTQGEIEFSQTLFSTCKLHNAFTCALYAIEHNYGRFSQQTTLHCS